ncbi:unnamed protein product [Prunus armeniaca]|uniref:Uncharacterized protein n=1 Tax=Prunus armeniaca TaxID=36596 RepID=A0A6J5WAM2_PRUAR|nr:unnamed protein product [Prunus armeniaca]
MEGKLQTTKHHHQPLTFMARQEPVEAATDPPKPQCKDSKLVVMVAVKIPRYDLKAYMSTNDH